MTKQAEHNRKRLETWEMLYDALAALEWITQPGEDEARCSNCGAWASVGHRGYCLLDHALKAGKEGL